MSGSYEPTDGECEWEEDTEEEGGGEKADKETAGKDTKISVGETSWHVRLSSLGLVAVPPTRPLACCECHSGLSGLFCVIRCRGSVALVVRPTSRDGIDSCIDINCPLFGKASHCPCLTCPQTN